MRGVAAIIEPAIDVAQCARRVAAAHIALRDAEQIEKQDVERADHSREVAARRRLELGRELMRVRGAWPARGPTAKGWGEFLTRAGIAARTARDYMSLAGYVEQVSATEADVAETSVPTYADAGIDKRSRADSPILADQNEDKPDLPRVGPAAVVTSSGLDIDRELSRLHMKIVAFAETCPPTGRQQLAHELRNVAQTIEEMT